MKPFEKILCPVDFSEFSVNALQYAVAFAKRWNAHLLTLHVVPDLVKTVGYLERHTSPGFNVTLAAEARKEIEEFVPLYVPEEIKETRAVQVGSPPELISQTADQEKVDLIIMGTHGRTGIERFLLGSVSHKVLHKSAVPVILVGKKTRPYASAKDAEPLQLNRLLCAVDMEEGSAELCGYAFHMANLFHAELDVIHVATEQNLDPEQAEALMMELRNMTVGAEREAPEVRYLVETGKTADKILQAAEDYKSDLIVTGHHSRMALREAFLGSTSLRILIKAPCPVLVYTQ